MSIRKMQAAGNGRIETSITCPVGQAYRVISVSCKWAIAPTTSENFTLTLNANAGSQYDVLLYSVDPASGVVTDLLWQPDAELFVVGGDAIDAAFTGTEGYAWAIEWTVKAVR
jgi:hypothetical protein